MHLGQLFVLLYKESKGPSRAFACEIIHIEEKDVKVAVFHPGEDFRIISATAEGRFLIGGRDTMMELKDPNDREKVTVARFRDTVLARLTDAERRAYENPAGDKKKKPKSTAVLPETELVPDPPKATKPPKKKEAAPAKKAPAKKAAKKAAKKSPRKKA